MPLFNKRTVKLKWRLLFIIIPVALIPISIILIYLYTNLYTYMSQEKMRLNDTLVIQIAQKIETNFQNYAAKMRNLVALNEISSNIYIDKYESKLDEDRVNSMVGGSEVEDNGLKSISRVLNINGVTYIINRDLPSLIRNEPYSRWLSGTIQYQLDIEHLINNDPLFKKAEDGVNVLPNGAKSSKLVFGQLDESSFSGNQEYTTMIWPIVHETASSPDPESTYFRTFILIQLNNQGDMGFLKQAVWDVEGIDQGTLYILDYNNNIMWSNWGGKTLDPEYDTDPEMNIFAHLLNSDPDILQAEEVQEIINPKQSTEDDYDDYYDYDENFIFTNSEVIDVTYNGNDYQTLILDAQQRTDMRSDIKLIYFYPKEVIRMPINAMIIRIVGLIFGFVFIIIIISILFSNSLVNPIAKLDYATNKVSQGYLDVDIFTESKDEIGSLYKNFKRMINTINEVLSNIQKSSNNLLGFQSTLDHVITDFSGTINSQASSIQESSTVFSQLNSSINEVSQSVKTSLRFTRNSQQQVKNANEIITEMVNEIQMIAETSSKISHITDLINGISEQTRLLSLNAAIEASRAGEAGKGFNVVASEIGKLARQSNQAANEIGSLIKMNDKRIQAGVNKTNEATEALDEINNGFQQIIDVVNKIDLAADEESKGSELILQIIDSFSKAANKNLGSISELSKTRDQLSMEVQKMRNLILAFKVQSSEREVINDMDKFRRKDSFFKKMSDRRKQKKLDKKKNIKIKMQHIENPEELSKYKPVRKKENILKKIFAKKNKDASKIKLPKKIKERKMNTMFEHVGAENDKRFLLTMYNYEEKSKTYFLKKEIQPTEKIRLSTIFKKL